MKKFCADRKPRVELYFDSPVLVFLKVKSRLFVSFPFKRYFLASLKNAWLYIFIRKKLLALHWYNIKLEYLTCMWPFVSSHYILGIIYISDRHLQTVLCIYTSDLETFLKLFLKNRSAYDSRLNWCRHRPNQVVGNIWHSIEVKSLHCWTVDSERGITNKKIYINISISL